MNDRAQTQIASFFDNGTIKELYREIQETYKANNYPWVIGFSGGKDSTATVQLVWYALADLPAEERRKPVFVINSDTLVETPVVVEQIDKTLQLIETNSTKHSLPFQTHKVYPKIKDSFWVNLLGKGYPAPNQRFRWCTERLKINPVNTFIIETAAEYGEVVMILGARKSESVSRAQVMGKRKALPGTRLHRHSNLTRAFVYTPIEDFTIDDVWTYLDVYDSPWGGDNRELAMLYRKSDLSGECPLVIDSSTPSCGNSRFGCWVCTVVQQDRSMQALIRNGEEWMEPLLDFRDFLSETQIPERKHEFRNFKRRNGQVIVQKDGRLIPGPYKFEFRKTLLKRLLATQQQIQINGPDPGFTLISQVELHEIRRIWRIEQSDWEDSLPSIYKEVIGKDDVEWAKDETGAFSQSEHVLLMNLCDQNDVPSQLVTRLIDLERRMQGLGKRTGIYQQIHRLFSEEWASKEEVLARAEIESARKIDLGIE